jgi:colanic acid biosynthesis glycosyl transferase WcaI
MEGLIVPSKFYGVAAVGRPTIAIGDPKGEIAQLVTDHNCGVAIDSGNSLKLVDTILALRNDNALVTQMSHNARALLDRSFRKQHALQNWECLLRSFDVD